MEMLFIVVPAAAIFFFIYSLSRYYVARIQLKTHPGYDTTERFKQNRRMLVISSITFAAVALVYILLFLLIAVGILCI